MLNFIAIKTIWDCMSLISIILTTSYFVFEFRRLVDNIREDMTMAIEDISTQINTLFLDLLFKMYNVEQDQKNKNELEQKIRSSLFCYEEWSFLYVIKVILLRSFCETISVAGYPYNPRTSYGYRRTFTGK